MNFSELKQEELEIIDGGSIFGYIGAVASVAFGLYEISTGIGATDGTKNVIQGTATIIGGLIVFLG